MKITLLAAAGIALWITGAARAEDAKPELRYVAMVTRHGVRAPTWQPERLREYSAEAWPDFGVPPSYLTQRGRELIRVLGSWYADWFRREGLLERTGCRDAARVYIWADTAQRTVETGRTLAETLLPGCNAGIHSAGDGEDSLFDAIASGLSEVDPARATAAVRDRMGDPAELIRRHRAAFDALQFILTGSGKAAHTILEPPAEIAVQAGRKGAELTGPLNVSSTLSENLLLEYANGFTGHDLGWGRLDAKNLSLALTLHGEYARLTRETPYVAGKRAWNLADRILQSMAQAAAETRTDRAMGEPGGKLLLIAGHDTNLSNLAGMLGLEWAAPGYQKNETPPGGSLLFTLWRDRNSGRKTVRILFAAQTPDQMRNVTPLSSSSPPALIPVHVPGCAAQDCGWERFTGIVRTAIAAAR